jgi:CBS domain-containing protein
LTTDHAARALALFDELVELGPAERAARLSAEAPALAAEVARMLASYDLVSLPVVDQAHRLVGAISVDDVLDYLLPDDWRSHDAEPSVPTQGGAG